MMKFAWLTDRFDTPGWAEFLIEASLVATVVVLVASLIGNVLRRASAATRHLLWLLALIAVLLGPKLARVSSGGWLHVEADFLVRQVQDVATSRSYALDTQPDIELQPRQPVQQGPAPSVDNRLPKLPHAANAASDLEWLDDPVDGIADPALSGPFAEPPPPLPAAVDAITTRTQLRPWASWVVVVWLAVSSFSILFVLGAHLLLSLQRLRYQPVTDAAVRKRFEEVAAELQVQRRVTLLRSDADPIPKTWGIVRPVLLLPATVNEWTDERLRMVLLHELAHIRRFDCLWQFVSALVLALHWFNPLVWLACRRVHVECERACDDVVLSRGVPASNYAEQLLDISTGGRRGVPVICAGLAMARSQRLADRLRAIVADGRSRNPVSRRGLVGAVMGTLLTLVPFSMIAHVTLATDANRVAPPGTELVEDARSALPRNEQQASSAEDAVAAATLTGGDEVPEDMQFVVEGRKQLAKIRFPFHDFTFVRVKYSSARPGGQRWATDYPEADIALSQRIDEWTSMNVNRDGRVRSLTDNDLGKYPFLYVSEPGSMRLSDAEIVALRKYFAAGGVLMADDFWGEAEWRNLQSQLKRVVPDVVVREVPDNNRMFRWPFRLSEKPQVCSIGVALMGREKSITWERDDARDPHYWWLIHDGRVIAICCQNTDLADGWERQNDSEWYSREFSEKRAFPMMMNILAFTLANPATERPGRVQIQHRRDPSTGAEQRIHPAVADHPEWLTLKQRLESSGMKYRSVDVDVAPKTVAGASQPGEAPRRPRQDPPATFISLNLAGTTITDLAPLSGAAIDALDLSHTPITDLSPLQGMKLRRLDLSGSAASDLSPLRGMPLEIVSVTNSRVRDLAPLTQARLKILEAESTQVSDIRPLAGHPLVYLDLRDTRVDDLSSLAASPLTSLQLEGAPVTDLRPLQRTPLKSLGLTWREGMDLRQLVHLPLNRLKLTGTGLSDIAPLAGQKLESLELVATSVQDLSPIASMPLRELSLLGTPATDLTPLKNMDLANLFLSEPGTDLAGIEEASVFFLQIPDPEKVKNLELLRSMKVKAIQAPGTKRISVAAFLKRHELRTRRRPAMILSDDDAGTLIRDLASSDNAVREQAARRLESFGPGAVAAVEPLILSLNDAEGDVVVAVGDALEAMGTAAVPTLMKGMDHDDAFIRHRCGFALSNIRPVAPGLVPKLVRHLSDEHQRVRLYAVISLGNLGPDAERAVPELVRTLETEDPEILRFTIEALGKIGPGAKAAVPALIELIGRQPGADVALGRIGPNAAAAVPILIGRYQNGFRANTLWALGRMGPPARAAIPMLTEALNSRSSKERENARVALAMITGNRHLDTRVLPNPP